jgi:hypothetical protein
MYGHRYACYIEGDDAEPVEQKVQVLEGDDGE